MLGHEDFGLCLGECTRFYVEAVRLTGHHISSSALIRWSGWATSSHKTRLSGQSPTVQWWHVHVHYGMGPTPAYADDNHPLLISIFPISLVSPCHYKTFPCALGHSTAKIHQKNPYRDVLLGAIDGRDCRVTAMPVRTDVTKHQSRTLPAREQSTQHLAPEVFPRH